jgi:hypothetical protein
MPDGTTGTHVNAVVGAAIVQLSDCILAHMEEDSGDSYLAGLSGSRCRRGAEGEWCRLRGP